MAVAHPEFENEGRRVSVHGVWRELPRNFSNFYAKIMSFCGIFSTCFKAYDPSSQ